MVEFTGGCNGLDSNLAARTGREPFRWLAPSPLGREACFAPPWNLVCFASGANVFLAVNT